jgi:hypothetical protein
MITTMRLNPAISRAIGKDAEEPRVLRSRCSCSLSRIALARSIAVVLRDSVPSLPARARSSAWRPGCRLRGRAAAS